MTIQLIINIFLLTKTIQRKEQNTSLLGEKVFIYLDLIVFSFNLNT